MRAASVFRNFYPRPPGGGRHHLFSDCPLLVRISIHALRVEGDFLGPLRPRKSVTISIHALRVEGDTYRFLCDRYGEQFLSTPSGWRATVASYTKMLTLLISIHALRVEGDVTHWGVS